jgi:uncharacterized membrane protein SirB2
VKLLGQHATLMFLYAVLAAAFFALLWRTARPERIRFFLFVFASLFLGGIILGWVMYPFPLGR